MMWVPNEGSRGLPLLAPHLGGPDVVSSECGGRVLEDDASERTPRGR